jgi:CxxC-x17-CxxC domain-containing protein
MRKFNKVEKFGSRSSGRFNDTSSKRSSGGKFGRRDSYSSGREVSKEYGDRPEKRFDKGSFSKTKDSGFTVHETVCDKCGVKCDVPFKPTNNKPIYCRSCYRQINSGSSVSSDRNNDRPNSSKSEFREPRSNSFENMALLDAQADLKREIEKINQKLDKIMKTLKI